MDASSDAAPDDSSSGGETADSAAAGEAASGGAGQPPPPADPSDPPGPPPIPFTPQGSSGGSGRTWILVGVGVALLFVVGIGALAVALVAGGSDDNPTGAAAEPTAPVPVTDAATPGTDAEMDALWVACADGDMQACDDLFVRSEVGSEYEEFGRTCGGRVDDALLCVDAFTGGDSGTTEAGSTLPEAGPEAPPPGTDAAMDELWMACADEDWEACDDLFFESGIGSEYEEFGRTCGYRIEDAFLCSQDMTGGAAGDEGALGGDIPGAGPDASATVAPATDEELDTLWTACQDEDWEACDRLYFESDAQSDYEFYGATCGARDLLDGGGQLCQVLHAEPGDPLAVLPTDLARGMCFDEPDEEEVVFWLQTVPCDDPHDVEIMGVATLPRGPIPEDMSAAAVDLCLPVFAEFVGIAYTASRLDIYHLSPTPESWELGDHDVACGVYDPDGPVEGSLKGSER